MEFVVTKKAQRGHEDEVCFYCRQPIGDNHKPDCVLIRKTVKVRVVIEYDVSVPRYWTKHDIEFHRNQGSWCSSNLIGELQAISEDRCLCWRAEFECLDSNGDPVLNE